MKSGIVTQRLIGAIVLVSLSVIFVPMILTGEGELIYKVGQTDMPPEPEYEFALPRDLDQQALQHEVRSSTAEKIVEKDLDLAARELSRGQITRLQADTTPAATKKPAATAEADKQRLQRNREALTPPPRSKNIQAWAVQVASFSQQERALALRDKLRKNKYVAYVESVELKDGMSWRVRIGPHQNRDAAESAKKKIHESLNLNGFVVRQ